MPLEIPAGILVTLLTLLFTLVIGVITVIALALGWSFYKRYDQVQGEYRDMKRQLDEAKKKHQEIMTSYAIVESGLDKITQEPERRRSREFLRTVMECLHQKKIQKLKEMTDDIGSAMFYISETRSLKDAMIIFEIFDYATELNMSGLAEYARSALKRISAQTQKQDNHDTKATEQKIPLVALKNLHKKLP